MEVGEWLRSLGLEEYEAAFRDNEIDDAILPKLTAEDLKDLGVARVGHRRKILAAAAELAGAPAAAAKPDRAESGAVERAAPGSAERRQLTLMFCDLVGSTALSARLDPEDMGDLIRAFQSAVAAAAARFDGNVAKFMGDGALIYFGYPRAHEDDAESAVRAGLALVQAVRALRTERGGALEVRAGIATGLVVVGELMGEGEARERGVVGETPNLAARLQALAEPGEVLVADTTRRLLGRGFELRSLGPQALKGFFAPVPAWAVLRESESVSRFEASRSDALIPLVGRDQEVALLAERWRDAAEGDGQVVLLSGEAGIGKSRILAALRERIAGERYVALRYQCSPHHANDAFHPLIGQIWRAAGCTAGEPAPALLDKLEAMVALSGLGAESCVPYLASLLSIPAEGRYRAPELTPGEIKERIVAVLIDLFVGLTQGAPVLVLLEDAHWIDPTSLDLFSRLADRLQELSALMVVTYRPEFAPPWQSRAHVTALSLNRFGRRHVLAMVERVSAGKALPAEVLEQIVDKTDGVPLFVEELTKTVLESGLLREEDGSYVLATALTPLAIPSTLQDSLMARLDRLASVREIAQIGAAIGREFSWRLLEAVSPISGRALQEALRQLISAEMLHGRGVPPDATYVFKHALVQDTAYATMLRGTRQRIHADIAQALTRGFADRSEAAPAIVAHHYTEAGLAEPAARAWLAAAERALTRSAHVEAGRYIEAGLAAASRMAEGPERQSVELALQLARANALMPLKGYTAPETLAALSAAKELLEAGIGADLQRFFVLYGLCEADYFAARLEPAFALAQEIVEVADRQDDTTCWLVGYRLLGTMQVLTGQHREALASLRQAERYRDPGRDKLLSYRFATDPGLAVLCCNIQVLLLLGRLAEAAAVGEELRTQLPDHGHAATVATCTFFATVWPELLHGNLEACESRSAELVAYCAERKVEHWRLLATISQACAKATREPTPTNIAALRDALEAEHRTGAWVSDSVFVAHLAEALLAAGDVAGAETALQEGFAFVERSGELFWLAEMHRLDGRIELQRPASNPMRAQACFLLAIEIARRQEARLLELRAATDLARLWRDSGWRHDPRSLLAPLLAAIEGGEAARDVSDARALFAVLV